MAVTARARQDAIDNLVAKHGKRKAMDIMAKLSGYRECPPLISEFITDPEYIGGQIEFFPVWKTFLDDVYPTPYSSPKLECILTGAIGQGKSSVSLGGIAYDMCKILCLEEPHKYYGLGKSKKLSFVLLNKTQDVSKDVLYDQIMSWFSGSPWFRKMLAKAPKSSTFPKEVNLISGSRSGQVLGHDVVSALLSELNFQTVIHDQASDNYSTVRSRLESRFMPSYQRRGTYPGRLWLDSSRDADNSFMETHAEKVKNDPLVKIADYAYWEVHGFKKGLYCGEKFPVFVGNKDRDPLVLDYEAEEDYSELSPSEIIQVPIEHKQAFVIDLAKALRDVAGRSLKSEMVFISSTEMVASALQRRNMVKKGLIVLDFYDEQQLIHMLDTARLLQEFPTMSWYVHFDLGLKHDRTGIAFSGVHKFREVQKYDDITGQPYMTKEPMVVTPVIFSIKNKAGSETPIYKLKQLIFDCKRQGIKFSQISADGYQSAQLLQDLKLAGYKSSLVSVDRTKDAYLQLRSCIMESRWAGSAHVILQSELTHLLDDGKKVDHPKKIGDGEEGSKDVSDSCAGSVSEALKNASEAKAVQDLEEYFEFEDADEASSSLYDMISKLQ